MVLTRSQTAKLAAQPFRFMDLPAEMRNRVYAYALHDDRTLTKVHHHVSRCAKHFLAFKSHDAELDTHVNVALLRVNRQVNQESQNILYANTTFAHVSYSCNYCEHVPLANLFAKLDLPHFKYIQHIEVSIGQIRLSLTNTELLHWADISRDIIQKLSNLKTCRLSFFHMAHTSDKSRLERLWVQPVSPPSDAKKLAFPDSILGSVTALTNVLPERVSRLLQMSPGVREAIESKISKRATWLHLPFGVAKTAEDTFLRRYDMSALRMWSER